MRATVKLHARGSQPAISNDTANRFTDYTPHANDLAMLSRRRNDRRKKDRKMSVAENRNKRLQYW